MFHAKHREVRIRHVVRRVAELAQRVPFPHLAVIALQERDEHGREAPLLRSRDGGGPTAGLGEEVVQVGVGGEGPYRTPVPVLDGGKEGVRPEHVWTSSDARCSRRRWHILEWPFSAAR